MAGLVTTQQKWIPQIMRMILRWNDMDIKKVAVLGAGAVGSYVIWGLSARRDIELGVVADGPRGERLKKDGCAINGKIYRPAVWTPQEAHDADLLIVCLKYGALPGALDSIKAVTGPHTTIMSMMNGVDSEDIIASAVGGEHLLYSLIKVASHKEADGFHFDPATTVGIIFGEKERPATAPASRPWRPCSAAQSCTSGPPTASGKRCGASSASTSVTTCPRPSSARA